MILSEAQSALGLDPQGHYTEEEVKKAYKRKALVTHPDKNNGDSKEFLKVQEAYDTLTGKHGPGGDPGPSPFGFDFGFDMGNLYDFMNHMGVNTHAGMGSRGPRVPPEHDRDVRMNLDISVEDIRQNKVFEIEYNKAKKCNSCNGIGGEARIKCATCNGTGMVRETQTYSNSTFTKVGPCPTCGGNKETIRHPCFACGAKGFVVYSEKLKFEIKEKK